jgi:hypothetical protein
VAALACASLPATGRAAAGGNLPYSKSTAITSFNLDWNSLQRKAPGSDNWAATWASDGLIYTTWGDGGGFGNVRVSLGFARLSGASAHTINGTNLPGNAPKGKSYGVLALGKTLYAWISPGSNAANYDEARLYAAPLGTNAWRRADWAFTKSDPARVILPTIVQAGKDYSQGVGYVYVYAPRYAPTQANRLSLQRTQGRGGEIALLRASRGSDLMRRDSWQFFAGLDQSGQPRWSGDAHQLQPVITDQNGVGWTVSATYDPALRRFLVATEHSASFGSHLTLLDAPNVYGPWSTAAYTTLQDPKRRIDQTAFHYTLLPNSLSGNKFTLAFTGTGRSDALLLVDGTFGSKSAD